jgi:hypothetical protein
MSDKVILGLPFIAMLYHFSTDEAGVSTIKMGVNVKFHLASRFYIVVDRTKNNTRQLHESFVIKWMCKYECRTHREQSFVIKINTTLKLNVS